MTYAAPLRTRIVLFGSCELLLSAVGCGGDSKKNAGGHAGAGGAGSESGRGGADAVGGRDAASGGAAESEAGAAGSDIPSVGKEQIGDDVFDESEAKSYYLTFSEPEYAKLVDLSTLLVDDTTVNEDRCVRLMMSGLIAE